MEVVVDCARDGIDVLRIVENDDLVSDGVEQCVLTVASNVLIANLDGGVEQDEVVDGIAAVERFQRPFAGAHEVR